MIFHLPATAEFDYTRQLMRPFPLSLNDICQAASTWDELLKRSLLWYIIDIDARVCKSKLRTNVCTLHIEIGIKAKTFNRQKAPRSENTLH